MITKINLLLIFCCILYYFNLARIKTIDLVGQGTMHFLTNANNAPNQVRAAVSVATGVPEDSLGDVHSTVQELITNLKGGGLSNLYVSSEQFTTARNKYFEHRMGNFDSDNHWAICFGGCPSADWTEINEIPINQNVRLNLIEKDISTVSVGNVLDFKANSVSISDIEQKVLSEIISNIMTIAEANIKANVSLTTDEKSKQIATMKTEVEAGVNAAFKPHISAKNSKNQNTVSNNAAEQQGSISLKLPANVVITHVLILISVDSRDEKGVITTKEYEIPLAVHISTAVW